MISEIVNAVFLTYVATEYTASSLEEPPGPGRETNAKCGTKLKRVGICFVIVLLVNVVDEATGIGEFAHRVANVWAWFHIPKVLIAAAIYVFALYYDCRYVVTSKNKHMTLPFRTDFLPRVTRLFIRILPIYPFAAVLISFGFMFVINLFELLHLPVDLLNWPIYYGTLYGPFSYIYSNVKQEVINECRISLPTSLNPPRRLGSQ